MNIFEEKAVRPMLLTECREPFDSDDHLFELKWDGIRAIAYLGGETVLKTRELHDVTARFPELSAMHCCGHGYAVIDGEIVLSENGKPDFGALQRRFLLRDGARIARASEQNPVQFIAFDLLYDAGRDLTDVPLIRRKALLERRVRERDGLVFSRFVAGRGRALFAFAERENLEGIVAKDKNSRYHVAKRTRDWLKIKVWKEVPVFVFGYLPDACGLPKVLIVGADRPLGKVPVYDENDRAFLAEARTDENCAHKEPGAVWLRTPLRGTVSCFGRTASGGMRGAVWRGFLKK